MLGINARHQIGSQAAKIEAGMQHKSALYPNSADAAREKPLPLEPKLSEKS